MRRGPGQWALLGLLLCAGCAGEPLGPDLPRVRDGAGLLDPGAEARLEKQLALTRREIGVDLHLTLEAVGPGTSLERLAAERLDAADPDSSRTALLLYDTRGQRLRVEVGYALEGVWPDAWIGELIHEHTRHLLDAGAVEPALRLSLRVLRDQLRSAGLRGDLPTGAPAALAPWRFASGGAGVSAAAPLGARVLHAFEGARPLAGPATGPAPSVEEAHERYLAWLARGRFETDLGLFTPQTRAFLAAWPMTPGYLEHVLEREVGRSFEVIVRDEHALIYCRNDPFVAPHFFAKGSEGWQMDLVVEEEEVLDIAGGPFSWSLRAPYRPALAPFADAVVRVDGYWRLRDGDNRRAPGLEAARRGDPTGPPRRG